MNQPSKLARVFFWLSGASEQTLLECPSWEQRKYIAFGATVLVPSIFAMMASAYAVSTLTDNWNVIASVSLVWGFIILTVDRALLATYRAYQGFFRKIAQFGLRLVVAALMGLTISHPITLLLFRDTIQSSIEKQRDVELEQVHAKAAVSKKEVEAKITTLDADIAGQRLKWDESFNARFLAEDPKNLKKPLTAEEAQAKAALEKKIAHCSGEGKAREGGVGNQHTQ